MTGNGEHLIDTGAVSVYGRARIVGSRISDNLRGGVYGAPSSRLDIVDSTVRDNGQRGVFLQRGAIRGSTISGNAQTGIQVGGSQRGMLRLSNSTVHGNRDGVLVSQSFSAVLEHVTVSGNTETGIGPAEGAASRASGTSRSRSIAGYGQTLYGEILGQLRRDARQLGSTRRTYTWLLLPPRKWLLARCRDSALSPFS